MQDIVINILFWIIDKIPGALDLVYKIISPVRLIPKVISFKTKKWSEQLSFSIYNVSAKTIYEIYVLIPIKKTPFEDVKIKISKDKEDDNVEQIGEIVFNYSIIRFNLIADHNNFILLKVYGLNSKDANRFKIKTNGIFTSKIKVLSFKTKEQSILTKGREVAVSFQIPKKFPYKKPQMKGIEILLSKK